MKVEYWTMFWYCGPNETICSKHKTKAAAVKAAKKCEDIGGLPHRIIKVVEVRGLSRQKRPIL